MNAADIDTTTILEHAIEEVFDRRRTCELTLFRCDRAAAWWHVYGCCGAVVAKCERHKHGVWVFGLPCGPGGDFECTRCGRICGAEFDRWEPIR